MLTELFVIFGLEIYLYEKVNIFSIQTMKSHKTKMVADWLTSNLFPQNLVTKCIENLIEIQ